MEKITAENRRAKIIGWKEMWYAYTANRFKKTDVANDLANLATDQVVMSAQVYAAENGIEITSDARYIMPHFGFNYCYQHDIFLFGNVVVINSQLNLDVKNEHVPEYFITLLSRKKNDIKTTAKKLNLSLEGRVMASA